MDRTQDLLDALCWQPGIGQQGSVLGIDVAPLDAARPRPSRRINRACISTARSSDDGNSSAPTPVIVRRRWRRIHLNQAYEARNSRVVDLTRRGVNPGE